MSRLDNDMRKFILEQSLHVAPVRRKSFLRWMVRIVRTGIELKA